MKNETFAWAASIIQKFQQERSFGEIVVKFEEGRIVHVQEKINRKPPKKTVR